MAAYGLDLRAVARLQDDAEYTRPVEVPQHTFAALLVHVRALREALLEAKGVVGWFAMQREKESSKHYIQLEARIASVLRAAQDGEGPGP